MHANTHHHEIRGPLWIIAVLMLVALVATAAARLGGLQFHEPDAPALKTRPLRFIDLPDGSIGILDPERGTPLSTLSGEQGFVRGALRALARERRRAEHGPDAPFELVARSDGRLTLRDPLTGQRIDLEAFGPTNAGAFARLLDLPIPDAAAEPQRIRSTQTDPPRHSDSAARDAGSVHR